jgi:hypothetical protein
VSLLLFVVALVLIASLNPDAAQVTLWLVLALWVVFLVMNPDKVQLVTQALTQANVPIIQAHAPQAPPAPPTIQRGKNIYA